MFVFGANSASTGYNLTRSLRTRSSASAYLNRTPSVAGSLTTWTWSSWIKRGTLSASGYVFGAGTVSTNDTGLYFETDNTLIYFKRGSINLQTSQVFRDISSWYHIVVAYDSTQGTASNRLKMYVNGTQVTAFATSTYPTASETTQINNNVNQFIARRGDGVYFDGYLTEVNFIDGQALTPSSFGSTNALTGVWQPARYTGTYGTNGFYLPFTDNSALTTSSNVGLGKDFSGNGNYWTTNNISITAGVTYDSMTDVPTLTSATAANFAVLNPLDVSGTYLSNGNQRITTGAAQGGVRSTMAFPTTAKIYFEVINASATSDPSTIQCGIGIANRSANLAGGVNGVAGIWGVLWAASRRYLTANGSSSAVIVGELAINSTMQVAVDLANGYAWVGVNNTWYDASNGTTGNPSTGANATFTSLSGDLFGFADVYSMAADANFGQRPFTYTPPTGFVALCTYNLPTSTIVKGNTVMDATLWAGNSSTQSIVNAAAFKTDFVWIKNRTGANNHALFDSVRGATLRLYSDSTIAEQTEATTLTAFNSNGFSVSTSGAVNASANNYVGWQWQAGQGSSSSNTNGTITSTVSVNASAGFSVVTYTGTGVAGTIGHGLGVAPQLIIVKPRSATITTDAWNVYHVSTGNTNFLVLNATDASAAASNRWNNTSPTSSVFSIGTVPSSVAVGYVAYCWAPIAGFSAFGNYTGNGSADGTFVYTGFRPKFLLAKRTDTTGNWSIHDTARNTYNVADLVLYPNLSSAEDSGASGRPFDILSNGFKARSTEVDINASGGTYIYMAFAESPFRNSLAR